MRVLDSQSMLNRIRAGNCHAQLKSTLPPLTTAILIFVGCSAACVGVVEPPRGAGEVDPDAVDAAVACLFKSSVTASRTAPTGASAISLTSLFVSTSVSDAPLDWSSIVIGPWNCMKSLSPQIVRRAHVRRVKYSATAAFHTWLCRTV